MLQNAILYKEQVREAFCKVWYDPKYQYYFGSQYRVPYNVSDGSDGGNWHDFVSLDKDGNLIGVISYLCDFELGLAYRFGAVNFTDDKITFGHDLKQVIEDIFIKFGMNTLDFKVIRGNPVEKSYDRIVQKIGGRILCVRRNRAKDLAGHLCDDKCYEVTREDFLAHYHKRGDDHA